MFMLTTVSITIVYSLNGRMSHFESFWAKNSRVYQDVKGTPSSPTYIFLLKPKSFSFRGIMLEMIHTLTKLKENYPDGVHSLFKIFEICVNNFNCSYKRGNM